MKWVLRTDKISDCLSSFENAQTRTRYINVAASYDGTLQWLFDRESVTFVDWLEEADTKIRPVFWINGKPGSGKSTLMKFAMRDERTRYHLNRLAPQVTDSPHSNTKWIILGFFFHDRGTHIQKSIEGMLQGVLHQLLSQLPDLLPFVYNIYDELVKAERNSKPGWTFDSLSAAWVAVTKQRKVRLNACLFLDALDEHEGDNNQLSKFIFELFSNADGKIVRIKICVASRNWNIFAIHKHTAGDIQAYTSERLSGPIAGLEEDARLTIVPKIELLSSQVTTKARGVFIWVRIVVDELVKGIRDGTAITVLEEKVSKMPEELGALYRHTLERVEPDYCEEAFIMLQITLCSLSPLPLDTFMNCVSFQRWGKVHEGSWDEMKRQLRSRSGGLLDLVYTRPTDGADGNYDIFDNAPADLLDSTNSIDINLVVQFIHQTVKDFVAENRSDLGLHLDGRFEPKNGFCLLLECATHYGRAWASEISPSIFEYAYLAEKEALWSKPAWYETFRIMLRGYGDPPDPSALSLREWLLQEYPEYQHSLGGLRPDRILLALAAASDLKDLVSTLLPPLPPERNIQDATRSDPELTAALLMVSTGPRLSTTSASRESMIKLLLKHGVDVNEYWVPLEPGGSPANEIGASDMYSILSWVLRQTRQKFISEEERYAIARLLLENGAGPEAFAVEEGPHSLLHNCYRVVCEVVGM
jgi:hypothetical protein